MVTNPAEVGDNQKERKMKRFRHILLWAALLTAGTALTACLSEILPEGQSTITYTLQVDAAKNAAIPGTRTLTDESTTLSATWNTTDVVEVYKGTEKVGTLTPDKAASTAILSGKVRDVAEGDELTLTFGTPNNYATQKGTLEYIDANCNYAEAAIQVTDIENNVVSTTDAAFENAQSITKFTFSKSVKSVRISGGATDINVTLDKPGTVAYVAMPGTTDVTTYTFDAYDDKEDGILLRGTKSATLENGKFYTASVPLAVSGGMKLLSDNPWSKTSGELSYEIPEGVKIKSASLVVNIYSGSASPTYGAEVIVGFLTDNGLVTEDLLLKSDYGSTDGTVYEVAPNVTKCYSDYQLCFDVTETLDGLDGGTTAKFLVETKKLEGYEYDGRIKMIALVVLFDGGENDPFTYWLNTTQRWTNESNTLTFNTSSYSGLPRQARLFNISTSSAIGNYQLNGKTMPEAQNTIFGSYYGRLEWDVTDMIVEGQNTVLTSQPSASASYNSLKDVVTLLVFEKK